jgi:hypothetical protein
MDASQVYYVEGKMKEKSSTLYDCIGRAFWKRQNYKNRKPIGGLQGLRSRGGLDYKASQGNLGW